MKQSAIHPIIYVRGYAMTDSEIEDTVADPYMGFNLGSCKVRQLWDGTVKKYFFESPIVRLLKEPFSYDDVYEEGVDRVSDLTAPSTTDGGKPKPVPYRSIVIYRYYEPSSHDLGSGIKPDMKRFARGLNDLILTLRDRIYPDGDKTTITAEDRAAGKMPYDTFRVYLVAHSMGGLVCRAFLQNPEFGSTDARRLVDKLFTYATPHNGIEVDLIGNVPGWLSLYGINTFNRAKIAELLGIPYSPDNDNCDVLTNVDPNRVFNLVGTNPADYKAAAGLSSLAVGDASDGLVRIRNATTRALQHSEYIPSPQAFVHRSHSGALGIVNSEEGFQNLTRFLFADVRADGVLEIDELTLPPAVQREKDANRQVRAGYFFEVTVSVRGKPWQLHRRTMSENSAIFRRYNELFPSNGKPASPTLFNLFLDTSQSQTKDSARPTLAFAADLCVRVPEYEVDKVLFLKDHFEGGYLFRDTVMLEAAPPVTPNDTWTLEFWFASERDRRQKAKVVAQNDGELTFEIPIVQATPPGIRARLRVRTTNWNSWQ
jgi:hypothetical protein